MPDEKADKKATRLAQKEARAQQKARAKEEAAKTKEALTPLQNRVQTLIQEYEDCASFEHARRMEKLLRGLLKAMETGCREAEKDIANISIGEKPCQPSVLRQRLEDLFWDTQ